jgi:hypothetical protein
MAIYDGSDKKNCGRCKNWGENNGPCGRCSQHFLPVQDPQNPDQKVKSITLDSWVCNEFVEK